MITKINRNHIYQVKYQGKTVINYGWKNPLDKSHWILTDDKSRDYSPFPTDVLKLLLTDSTVEIIDRGTL